MTVQTLPNLTLTDQHDQPQIVGAETRYLLFTADKDASNLVDVVLDGQTAATLATAGIRYVADISGMPGMVTTLFALPKLRKRPYPILLGRTPDDTQALPREPGKVTVIVSDGGTVTALHFLDHDAEIRKVLGLAPQ
jgi:hypothetical protein